MRTAGGSSNTLSSTGGNSRVLDESVCVTRAVSTVLALSKLEREDADSGGEPKQRRVSSPWQSGSSGSALSVPSENLASGSKVLGRGLGHGGDSSPADGSDGTGATGAAGSRGHAKMGRGAGRPVLGNGSDLGLVYGPLVENGAGLASLWKLSKGPGAEAA